MFGHFSEDVGIQLFLLLLIGFDLFAARLNRLLRSTVRCIQFDHVLKVFYCLFVIRHGLVALRATKQALLILGIELESFVAGLNAFGIFTELQMAKGDVRLSAQFEVRRFLLVLVALVRRSLKVVGNGAVLLAGRSIVTILESERRQCVLAMDVK